MYIFRLSRRPPAGMATAGSAASRRDPGRPCPFSIEHILSSLPERRPPARPPQPVGGRNPAEPDEPEAPVPAAPCACCCCCNPRAAPRGTPETSSGPGECARRGKAWRGSRGAPCGASPAPPNPNWNRNPTTDPAPPRRFAPGVAAEAGASHALPLDGSKSQLPGADWHERSRPAAAHAATPNHLQRGAAAGARGALRTEPVSRRGHTRTLGGPHPPAGGARGGGCSARSLEANSGATLLFQRPTFQKGLHLVAVYTGGRLL